MSVMDRWEKTYLDPDSVLIKAEHPCIKCDCEADVEVGGDLYCLSCAYDEFHTSAEENEYCDCCGDELDGYYKIGIERYCDSCFEQLFRM